MTSAMNITASIGMKTHEARVMPFSTPVAMMANTTSHRISNGQKTPGTKWNSTSTLLATCRKLPVRNPSGSSPQAFVTENPT